MEELQRPEYIDDIKRICKVSIDNGYVITFKQAEEAWMDYSDGLAAGWLTLGNDEEIWFSISTYVEEYIYGGH